VTDDFQSETHKLADAIEQHAARTTHEEAKRLLHDAVKAVRAAARCLSELLSFRVPRSERRQPLHATTGACRQGFIAVFPKI
jgi:hypothetical protein